MKRVVFVDVDDTLVRYASTKRIPMPAVISEIKRLHAQGDELYLWSTGGAAYCKEVATDLGIVECFAGFLPKPSAYIDDQAVNEWRYCRHFLPSQAGDA